MKLTNDLIAQNRGLSFRVVALESEKVTQEREKREAIDKLALATQVNKTVLEEKNKEIDMLKSEVARLQSREINQGALVKTAVRKVIQTSDFGELAVQLSAAATSIGKHETLKSLMTMCPQLKLRKKALGWDPYAQNRANKLQ